MDMKPVLAAGATVPPIPKRDIVMDALCRDLAAGDMDCPRTKAMHSQLTDPQEVPSKRGGKAYHYG